MSTDNVTPIRPGVAGTAPVKNPKTRGRPKGTISLNAERRRRDARMEHQAESPYHPSVKVSPPERGQFHYPKELLLQTCFKNNYGWLPPTLSSGIILCDRYISSMGLLLKQLEAEGHDVTAPKLEWLALLETAKYVEQLWKDLFGGVRNSVLKNIQWNIEFDGYRI